MDKENSEKRLFCISCGHEAKQTDNSFSCDFCCRLWPKGVDGDYWESRGRESNEVLQLNPKIIDEWIDNNENFRLVDINGFACQLQIKFVNEWRKDDHNSFRAYNILCSRIKSLSNK